MTLTPEILATVDAERHWNYDTTDAWKWITECQQMRDFVDPLIRSLTQENFVSYLLGHNFTQYTWFLDHYYYQDAKPTNPSINWSQIIARWLTLSPAHTFVPDEADRVRCYEDIYHEYRLIYAKDGPLSSSHGSYRGMDAGGGSCAWIFWRGKQLEHYSYLYQQLADAREFTNRCLYLEHLGLDVPSVISSEDWFLQMDPGDPYIPVLAQLLCYHICEDKRGQIAFTHLHNLKDEQGYVRVLYYDGSCWHKVRKLHNQIEPWSRYPFQAEDGPPLRGAFGYYIMDQALGWTSANLGQDEHAGHIFAPIAGIKSWMQSKNIFPNFFEPDGGPWCPANGDFRQCDRCAGRILF